MKPAPGQDNIFKKKKKSPERHVKCIWGVFWGNRKPTKDKLSSIPPAIFDFTHESKNIGR